MILMTVTNSRMGRALVAGIAVVACVSLLIVSKSESKSREPLHLGLRAAAAPIDNATAPSNAVYAWGDNTYATAPAAGVTAKVTAGEAVSYFRQHAFTADARTSVSPIAHFWMLTDQAVGLSDLPVWALEFDNVSQDPVAAGSHFAGKVLSNCTEFYLVNANTGIGLVDWINCPPQ